jgi:hypothetical protein
MSNTLAYLAPATMIKKGSFIATKNGVKVIKLYLFASAKEAKNVKLFDPWQAFVASKSGPFLKGTSL